jgi:hypothetical protein
MSATKVIEARRRPLGERPVDPRSAEMREVIRTVEARKSKIRSMRACGNWQARL